MFVIPKNVRDTARAWLSYIAEIVRVVVIAFAIILPIRYFLVQPFYVRGASMEPNFSDHEYLIIDELSYRFREPVRGEIVVFHYPTDPRQYFIKRVIGLPGETVSVREGKVFLQEVGATEFRELDEDAYLNDIFTTSEKRITLGQDEYFVLGDNRQSSLDSRTFGPLPRNQIVGRVWLRGWPIDKLAVFGQPIYND